MRIGFLCLDYPSALRSSGGVGTSVRTLARSLAARGHEVVVLALRAPGEDHEERDQGVRVVRFRQGNLHYYGRRLGVLSDSMSYAVRELERGWGGLQALRRLHARRPFDLVEIQDEGCLLISFLFRGCPVVQRLHGDQYIFDARTPGVGLGAGQRLLRPIQRAAAARCAALAAPSRAHAELIRAELGGRAPQIAVLSNAVDLSRLAPAGGGPEMDRPAVLFAGTVSRRKGFLVLLDAIPRVLERLPRARFYVIGGGWHTDLPAEKVREHVRGNRLEESVKLIGPLPQESLFPWYAAADLTVIPSYYETFCLTALESMAHGTPVVASASGGLPEVVEDGVSGLLVPPGDPRALADGILKLLENPDLRRRMGQAGRRRAAAFGVEESVRQAVEFYERVLRASTAGRPPRGKD